MESANGAGPNGGRPLAEPSVATWSRGSRSHHEPGGGFRNPWPVAGADGGPGSFLRWRIERLRQGTPVPSPGSLCSVESRPARPWALPGELRITWVGHATFLIQIGAINLLTDPVWSRRVSPVSWLGPGRLIEPGLRIDALPPIDAVLLSHDHYDHLDRPTVYRLADRFGPELRWITPLGYAAWLGDAGVRRVVELDWWQSARLATGGGSFDVIALPAQHWSRRSLLSGRERLWASFAVRGGDGRSLYFAGDSGYFPGYAEIGRELAPFDATLLPIGAYEPRWFMRAAHMNPEEAVRAFNELGGAGAFVAMHWGTFQLSDEPVLEPPDRLRRAWREEALPEERLWVPRHGETRVLRSRTAEGA